jgi:hypothetical protein
MQTSERTHEYADRAELMGYAKQMGAPAADRPADRARSRRFSKRVETCAGHCQQRKRENEPICPFGSTPPGVPTSESAKTNPFSWFAGKDCRQSSAKARKRTHFQRRPGKVTGSERRKRENEPIFRDFTLITTGSIVSVILNRSLSEECRTSFPARSQSPRSRFGLACGTILRLRWTSACRLSWRCSAGTLGKPTHFQRRPRNVAVSQRRNRKTNFHGARAAPDPTKMKSAFLHECLK